MKNFKNRLLFLFLFIALCYVVTDFAFATGNNEKKANTQAHTISVGGSTSVTPLMELFQAEYEKANSNIKITISSTGSGDGIKGATAGTYEIGMSSRELTPNEIGTGLKPIVIAIDGIAVILNNKSPISNLNMNQVMEIYTGKITHWEQLGLVAKGKTGGIAVVSRESGSGTRSAFQELLKLSDSDIVPNAIIFDGTGAVKSTVAGNVDAIGYISLGSVDNSIKAISINGVNPSNYNVINGSYKISRPFILVFKSGVPLNPATKEFLAWTLSDAGQNIVNKNWISVGKF